MTIKSTIRQFANFLLSPIGFVIVRNQKQVQKQPPLISGMKVDVARKFFWFCMYLQTKGLKGDIAEFGVAAGQGLAFWMSLKKQYSDPVKIWAFDSYEGFPSGTKDKDASWFLGDNVKSNYRQYTLDYVKTFLRTAGYGDTEQADIQFVKGFIPDSLHDIDVKDIRLANLDLDLYQSTYDALIYVWPRLVSGGIVIFDEYDSNADLEKWPGSKKAIDEFCQEHNLVLNRHFTNRVYLIK